MSVDREPEHWLLGLLRQQAIIACYGKTGPGSTQDLAENLKGRRIGIPNNRSPPFGFEMLTRRTGGGLIDPIEQSLTAPGHGAPHLTPADSST